MRRLEWRGQGVAVADVADGVGDSPTEVQADYLRAAADLDSAAMRELLERALGTGDIDTVVVDILLPVMHRIGDLWERGGFSVLTEHTASAVVRSVITEARRGEEGAPGRTVVLACPPGELHDLPTHLFAAMLRERGCRTVALGASVPWPAIVRAVQTHRADACVIAGMRPHSITARGAGLRRMGASLPVYIAGPATYGVRLRAVTCLSDDWRVAADVVAATATPRAPLALGEAVSG